MPTDPQFWTNLGVFGVLGYILTQQVIPCMNKMSTALDRNTLVLVQLAAKEGITIQMPPAAGAQSD